MSHIFQQESNMKNTNFLQDNRQFSSNLDSLQYPSKSQNAGDLQEVLDTERRQFRQTYQTLQNQIDSHNEQIQSLQKGVQDCEAENKDLQDQLQKHEVRIQYMVKENHMFESQKHQNQQQLMQYSDQINQKIKKMQEVIDYGAQQYDLMESQFNQSVQKKEASHFLQRENLQREYDFKYKTVEERCQNTLGHCRLLENEIKILNETILKMKLKQEEEIKEISIKVQDEEYRKWIAGLKMVEAKIKVQDEKNQELIQKLHEMHKQIIQQETLHHNSLIDNCLTQQQQGVEVVDLNHKLENHGLMMNKYQSDMNVQQQKHQNLNNDLKKNQIDFQNFKNQGKAQIEKKSKDNQEEIKYLNDQKSQLIRKLADLEFINQKKDQQYNVLKKEYDRITDSLQNNIHKTINQTMYNATQNQSQFPKSEMKSRIQDKY